ncbi:hypothetical protein ACWD5Q_32530 [Streptomyces sp. NPDC002513]
MENAVRADVPRPLDTLSRSWAERLNELWLAQLGKLSENPPNRDPMS